MNGRTPDKGKQYSAALYLRLSKDDEGSGESESITSQRTMLRAYAAAHHFAVYDEYVDDGVSGTTFDRPAFRRMLADIEAKRVNLVLTKDLSRLGRDYIRTGQYTEIYFPARQVRYIAVNDGYDSDSPFTEIAPFKNVVNELYARDTSKKIRSAFAARMQAGAFVGAFAPYGYRRDPEDRHHLLPDAPAAEIVREIFHSAAGGSSALQIARELNRRRVPPPLAYRRQNALSDAQPQAAGTWSAATVGKLLNNPVYLGHMAQGKTARVSWKSHVCVQKPASDWYVVENTHQPLVSQDVFDMARQRRRQRTCPGKGRFSNLFSGLARCADCGGLMSSVGSRKKGATANLVCGTYKRFGKERCTNHFIDYDLLCAIVLRHLQPLLRASPEEEGELLAVLQNQKSGAGQRQTAARLSRRARELEMIAEKMYEDYAAGILSADRMKSLLQRNEAEAEAVARQIGEMNRQESLPQPDGEAQRLRQLLHPTELTRELLCLLVDRIEIGQGVYVQEPGGKVKRQTVTVWFRCAGTPTVSEDVF